MDPEQTMRDFMAQVPPEVIAERTEHDNRSHEHDVYQSQQRMARTVLTLLLVGVPVAGLLLFFGTRNAPTGTEAPEAPPARVEPLVRAAPPVQAEMDPEGSLALELRPRGDCWVSLTIDGELVFERTMHAGERESYEADDEISLIIGDAGAFAFVINQQDGRSLGASGEVVVVRITLQNYRSYVVR